MFILLLLEIFNLFYSFFWAWNSDPAFGGNTDQCISPQYKVSIYFLN